jgi:plastocyanin
MKYSKLAIILFASVAFAGCTNPFMKTEEEVVPAVMVEDSMEADDAMVKDGAVMEEGDEVMQDEVMEGDESMEGDEAMMEEPIQLNASNFTFEVETIEANMGEELVVTVTNVSGVHDFVIDELDINTGLIPEGESVEVSIPTDQVGEFEYYCSVGQHRDLGMKGMLTIN